MDDFRARRRRFFGNVDDFMGDDFFNTFEEEFQRMQENMGHFFDEAVRNPESEHFRRYVYGFSMHPGPNGKPVFEEFGNVPRPGEEQIPGEREPLVDILEGKDAVTVIAEVPGVVKKDIDLKADERSLVISVETHDRRYHKELELPCDIDPESIKAQYKNGVLEVKFKRLKPKQTTKKIKIR